MYVTEVLFIFNKDIKACMQQAEVLFIFNKDIKACM